MNIYVNNLKSPTLRSVYEEAMGQLPGAGTRILDHGCGDGGSRSLRILTGKSAQVVGVDRCTQALSSARESYPGVRFAGIKDGRIDLESGGMDGAFSGFCLNEAPTFEVLAGTTAEICRVLRYGAPLVILTLNPDSIGLEFPGHRTEAPLGRSNGSPIVSTELRTGRQHHDFFWDEEAYRSALSDGGFRSISVQRSTSVAGAAPFMILSALK